MSPTQRDRSRWERLFLYQRKSGRSHVHVRFRRSQNPAARDTDGLEPRDRNHARWKRIGKQWRIYFYGDARKSPDIAAISATNLTWAECNSHSTVASSTIGVPTGTVRFMSGGRQLGAGALDTNGKAVLNAQQLLPGKDVLTVYYPGDHNFQPSNSASVTVTVANELLTLTIHPANSISPQVKPKKRRHFDTDECVFRRTILIALDWFAVRPVNSPHPTPHSAHSPARLYQLSSSLIPVH